MRILKSVRMRLVAIAGALLAVCRTTGQIGHKFKRRLVVAIHRPDGKPVLQWAVSLALQGIRKDGGACVIVKRRP